ncbi:MAG: hypothetical protein KAI40_06440 [Desulfobacterales bacterium]|nr:hypothetical protein [Desulfobacterales bacterium]
MLFSHKAGFKFLLYFRWIVTLSKSESVLAGLADLFIGSPFSSKVIFPATPGKSFVLERKFLILILFKIPASFIALT